MSEEKFKLIISNLPAVTGLLAVTLSILTVGVNYYISKRQAKMQLATTVEKEWIEIMRKTVADTLSTGRRVTVQRVNWKMSLNEKERWENSATMIRGELNKAITNEEEDRKLLNELCEHLRANGHILQIYLNQEGSDLERIFFENIDIHIRKVDNNNFDNEVMTYDQSYNKVLLSFKKMINAKQVS